MNDLEELKRKLENKKKATQPKQVPVFPLVARLRQRLWLIRERVRKAYQQDPNFSHVDNFMQKSELPIHKVPKKVENEPTPSYIM